MASPAVSIVEISSPILAIGKHFTGSYDNSQKYTMEVLELLTKSGIEFTPNKVFGIYYDDPIAVKPEDTRSFHGFFPDSSSAPIPQGLENYSFKGKFLKTSLEGDPDDVIMQGYEALFKYIKEQKIELASDAGFQITSFENGKMNTEIYMQVPS